MSNKTIQTTTIDGKEATVFWITSTQASMGRCKVGYSIGNFNPDPAPGVWTSVKTASYWLDYDEDNDGDIYEFLLPKIAAREGLTVTGVVSPPIPE
tara:strand:- start:249 stop:536 length:288 start_codon:yes stop_codon:yes gene_type:complete